ncbi:MULTISPECIES: hypothetical protein [Aeromicrobium]|uniref:hypothetical protein n=1 Tax=Aeromicrobium TaxID=2040 RepID=UPI00257DEEC7|nr:MULTISPECIES: hypothetical protein [Aeromicrobium]
MGTGRLKTIAITLVMLVVIGGAGVYIATEYGRSRAITVIAAVGLVAALAWVILTIVSIITATSARRILTEEDTTLRNEQRPVARRTILPGDDKQVGRRRKDPSGS